MAGMICLIYFFWPVDCSPADHTPVAREFTLFDQYGRCYEITYPQEKVCMLVFADKWGCSQVEGWVRPIYERYKDAIMILGVANLANVPSWLQPTLINIFKLSIKYSIMMDWTGDVSKDYGYPGGKAFVVIVDRKGVIQERLMGRASVELIEKCCNIINALRFTDPIITNLHDPRVTQAQ